MIGFSAVPYPFAAIASDVVHLREVKTGYLRHEVLGCIAHAYQLGRGHGVWRVIPVFHSNSPFHRSIPLNPDAPTRKLYTSHLTSGKPSRESVEVAVIALPLLHTA